MTKLRRFFSTILTLALFLNMIPPAHAQEEEPGRLSMTASAQAVSHGDTFTVSIAASQSFETGGAGMTVSYDPAVLEPVLESSSAASPFRISGPMDLLGRKVLRISFFPEETAHTFAADQALAVLTFRALKPADSTALEMTAAYVYDSSKNLSSLQPAAPVNINIASIPVEEIKLDVTALSLEIGASRLLKATVKPENASDKTVTWTSSDETKVTVEDGRITGLAITEEPVVITAAAAGYTAECTVNVEYPPDAGYVVTMPRDGTVTVGETIAIAPVIGNAENVGIYNAYDITFTYDPDFLQLITTQLEDSQVTASAGKINILHYGSDQAVDTAPFTLMFKTLKTGDARVTLAGARIDHSENAIIQNTAKAFCEYETVKFAVQGYSVNLPEDFIGAAVAEPGQAYSFEARNKLYDYSFEGSTMNSQSVSVIDRGNGIYTIENVTGSILLQTQKTGKTFTVVQGTDMTGESTARYMEDYTATLHEQDGYTYSVHIAIDGVYYGDYTRSGDTFTIPGEDITGNIVFTVTKTPVASSGPSIYHKVTFEGSGAGAAEGNPTSVADRYTYTLTLNKEDGYSYTVTYTMGSRDPVEAWPNAEDKYSVADVTGNLVFTIEKQQEQPHDRIEVEEYISLREGTMYLVLVYETLENGEIYTYGDSEMYYSWVYGAWCILTPESELLTQAIAESRISRQSGQMTAIGSAGCDVNMTDAVDINDAQLAYDLYNGRYDDFSLINMEKFLNADVNADRKITVADAAAVASAIQ